MVVVLTFTALRAPPLQSRHAWMMLRPDSLVRSMYGQHAATQHASRALAESTRDICCTCYTPGDIYRTSAADAVVHAARDFLPCLRFLCFMSFDMLDSVASHSLHVRDFRLR